MKKIEIVAIVLALGIFLFVGCNYNKIFPGAKPVVLTDVEATSEFVTETAPPATEEPTTLKTYDFSHLNFLQYDKSEIRQFLRGGLF